MTHQELTSRIQSADLRALARAATLIENQAAIGRELVKALPPQHRPCLTIGITGPPGAGKSTLVAALTGAFRHQGKTVAVIAVDPTSPFSHGALLGDRIRMQQHHSDPGVFIRSIATRGQLGGLAACVSDLVTLFKAAGFDIVLIETVGVGQDEIDIAGRADVTLVVLAPGQGDDVQAFKAGIMEIADVFVINKADLAGAEHLEHNLRSLQSLTETGRTGSVPICRVVSTTGEGVDELLSKLIRVLPEAKRVAPLSPDKRGIAAIDHLGIAVHHLDEALAFYRDQLGLRFADAEEVTGERVRVAMSPVGTGLHPPRIELLEATDPASTIARFLEKRGPGLHHVALRVPDLQATVDRLLAVGAKILSEPRAGAGGHLYVFVHPQSTGGVLLELIQQ